MSRKAVALSKIREALLETYAANDRMKQLCSITLMRGLGEPSRRGSTAEAGGPSRPSLPICTTTAWFG
jgi:hypothetical protein